MAKRTVLRLLSLILCCACLGGMMLPASASENGLDVSESSASDEIVTLGDTASSLTVDSQIEEIPEDEVPTTAEPSKADVDTEEDTAADITITDSYESDAETTKAEESADSTSDATPNTDTQTESSAGSDEDVCESEAEQGDNSTEEEEPTADTITVTFVIANEDYTNDPNSGNTHLAIDEPIAGSDLIYTQLEKGGLYYITGVGTVCAATIPVNTSLADNDLSTPNLEVANTSFDNSDGAVDNLYTYLDKYSWETEAGTVVDSDTILSETTTAYLRLTEAETAKTYQIQFICPHGELILSGSLVELGESISQEDIDSATAAAYGWTSDACECASQGTKNVSGWQVKDSETGECTGVTGGLSVTDAYVNYENNTVNVYAVWEENNTDSGDATDTTSDSSDGNGANEAGIDTAAVTEDGTEQTDTENVYAARVEALLAATDEEFVELWMEYDISASEEDASAFEDYISSLESNDPDTFSVLVARVDELINSAVDEAAWLYSATTSNFSTTTTTKVNYYVFVNGDRMLLQTVDAQTVYNSSVSGSSRYYITGDVLEQIYGSWGFSAEDLATARYFPHASSGSTTVSGGYWYVYYITADDGTTTYYNPISAASEVDVYYFPTANFSGQKDYTQYASTNTFYSVTVSDSANMVYTSATMPSTTYTFTGETATVTVSNGDGYTWVCTGADSTTVTGVVDEENNTTTFTIEGIAQAYTIMPVLSDNQKYITYDIGTLPYTPADTDYATPTIHGGSTYTAIGIDTYSVLAPSVTTYFYKSGKYLGDVVFLGWAVNGDTTTENLIKPGTILDLSQYDSTAIALTAQWESQIGGTGNKDGPMINFFVALNAVSEGTKEWTGNTETSNFTGSVYTSDCQIDTTTAIEQGLYDSLESGQYIVIGGTSGTDLDSNHSAITTELGEGYTMTGSDGNSYTYQATFPTDEEVLRTIRQMVNNGETTITINGHTITSDELTEENFTIKWYVFKIDTTDSWHIDGILVAKEGQLVVTKTFAGDEDAIAAIKSGDYSITVAGDGDTIHSDRTLTLSDSSYSSYTESTDTYTWVLDVNQYYSYTVTENGYTPSDTTLISYSAQYAVKNSITAGENTSGWVSYSSSVTVTGQTASAEENGRQTVSFLNTYTAPGTVILQKVDAATGELMPNVSFTIAKANNSDFGVYSQGNGAYTADPDGMDEADKTTTITTNSLGQAYLYVGGGTYTFVESVPSGYTDPGAITVELQGTTDNDYKVITITSITAENGDKYVEASTDDESNLVMSVKNYSNTVPLTIEKIWADGEDKSVVLQLYRNGVSMGSDYSVELDGTEDDAWTYTFSDIPLYANGEAAQYSLKEKAIGDIYFSAGYTDGYVYYDVDYYDISYADMTYLDSSGNTTTDVSEAASVYLSVTNKRSTGVDVVITKQVEGNMGDGNREFSFTVTAGSGIQSGRGYELSEDGKTATFTLKDDESVTLQDIYRGDTITIVETDADDYDLSITVDGVELENGQYTISKDIVEQIEIIATNTKNVTIETGLQTDKLPYLIGICLSVLGLAATGRKKRESFLWNR